MARMDGRASRGGRRSATPTAEVLFQDALRLHQSGALDKAAIRCEQVLKAQRRHAPALHLAGLICHQRGDHQRAEQLLRESLAIEGKVPGCLVNLGLVLMALGRYQAALDVYDRALALAPQDTAAHSNRGNALRCLGRSDEAMRAFDAALALAPNHFDAHNNRGNLLKDLGRFHDALAAYDAALRIRPNNAKALNNRGIVLKNLGRIDEACQAYDAAVRIAPSFAAAHSNRLLALQYWEGANYTRALTAGNDAFNRRFARTGASFGFGNDRSPDRPLRIGYVSCDFRHHPVGYFMQAVAAHHRAAEVEVLGFSTSRLGDELTAFFQKQFAGWYSLVGLSDESAAERIRSESVDVLIDLAGHTANNRLPMFAYRPAPVQVTWLGYSDTTGLDTMDYIVADRIVVPDGEEGRYRERVWRLPNSYLCYTPPETPASIERESRQAGGITFASFNNTATVSASPSQVRH